MKELLEFIARNLVDAPDAVRVTEEHESGTVVLRLEVDPDDVGKVIGRGEDRPRDPRGDARRRREGRNHGQRRDRRVSEAPTGSPSGGSRARTASMVRCWCFHSRNLRAVRSRFDAPARPRRRSPCHGRRAARPSRTPPAPSRGGGGSNGRRGHRGEYLFVEAADSPRLPEGEFWPHELTGMTVVTAGGIASGTCGEVLRTTANDIWTVTEAGGETLVPALKDVVLDVDRETRMIAVADVPGITVPDRAGMRPTGAGREDRHPHHLPAVVRSPLSQSLLGKADRRRVAGRPRARHPRPRARPPPDDGRLPGSAEGRAW